MIKKLMEKRFIVLDGGMGSLILEAKLVDDDLIQLANLSTPARIKAIHLEYLKAGADIITTNTFSINSEKLGSYKVLEKVIENAITAAKCAIEEYGRGFVAYNIGPSSQLAKPVSPLAFEKIYNLYKEQIIIADNIGVDLAILETFTDLLEIKAAVLAVKENTSLPVFATMSFAENQRTFSGDSPEALVATLEDLEVDALGVNCSNGPKGLKEVISRIKKVTNTPVIAKPNAGLPIIENGKAIYSLTPKEFTKQIMELVEAGATIVGGCCGTTPEYIAQLTKAILAKKHKHSGK